MRAQVKDALGALLNLPPVTAGVVIGPGASTASITLGLGAVVETAALAAGEFAVIGRADGSGDFEVDLTGTSADEWSVVFISGDVVAVATGTVP